MCNEWRTQCGEEKSKDQGETSSKKTNADKDENESSDGSLTDSDTETNTGKTVHILCVLFLTALTSPKNWRFFDPGQLETCVCHHSMAPKTRG